MSVEEAVAREHIRDTIARYNMAADSLNVSAFVDVFTDDALYTAPVFRCDGKAAIEAFVKRWWFAVPTRPVARFWRHHITTTQIDLTGPRTANGRVYYVVFTDLGPDHCGHYIDRYREEGGRWRICEREALTDWCNPASLFVPERVKAKLAELTARDGPFVPLGKDTDLVRKRA